jgi:hypothetical protein
MTTHFFLFAAPVCCFRALVMETTACEGYLHLETLSPAISFADARPPWRAQSEGVNHAGFPLPVAGLFPKQRCAVPSSNFDPSERSSL